MSAIEWWAAARADDVDTDAWHALPREDRNRIAHRVKVGLRADDVAVREAAWHVAEHIAIADMDTATASDHLSLEIAASFTRGRPLDPAAPVPGCGCPDCTGIPADHPSRVPAWRRADPDRAARSDDERRLEWERLVDVARSFSILDVAQMLGCGDPKKRGRELHVRCPLHEDSDPSCRLDTDSNIWYCDPCGEGGDAIALYMRARRIDFTEAVRELAA